MQQTGRPLCSRIVIFSSFFLYLETLRIAWSNTLRGRERWAEERRDISSSNRHEAFDRSRDT